jgi:hypothetical protein
MTKAELFKALEGVADDEEIGVFNDCSSAVALQLVTIYPDEEGNPDFDGYKVVLLADF